MGTPRTSEYSLGSEPGRSKIIEDAALALGTEDYGKPVGAWADATVFSFAPFKPLGSVGNGAVVTTNNDGIADRVRLFGFTGSGGPAFEDADGRQRHVCEGFNVPHDFLQAAILTAKLPFLANSLRSGGGQSSGCTREVCGDRAQGSRFSPGVIPYVSLLRHQGEGAG